VAFDPLLETLQGDPDPDARYGAARVLGMIGNPRAVPHLIKSLSDPEPAVRYWAIDALVMLDADEAKNVILDLIDDPYDWVGRRALNAMNQLFLS
jgi:HEAT repeat protein